MMPLPRMAMKIKKQHKLEAEEGAEERQEQLEATTADDDAVMNDEVLDPSSFVEVLLIPLLKEQEEQEVEGDVDVDVDVTVDVDVDVDDELLFSCCC
mmetsp:Transcript_17157/g.17215  ORF Transcript_17157/g.17215 Transcript_17157/m.17215 type:complete len:97 (-) Transcript_17157:63-353(-)